MNFEWNESKRLANINKHGVDFRLAAAIFFGPTIEADDTREDYGELRRLALGRVATDHFVVYTLRGQTRQTTSSSSTPFGGRHDGSSAHGGLDDMTANDTKTYSSTDIAQMIASGDHSHTNARTKTAGPALDRAF